MGSAGGAPPVVRLLRVVYRHRGRNAPGHVSQELRVGPVHRVERLGQIHPLQPLEQGVGGKGTAALVRERSEPGLRVSSPGREVDEAANQRLRWVDGVPRGPSIDERAERQVEEGPHRGPVGALLAACSCY